MNLTLQKRLSASVMGCGAKKVYIDPEALHEVSAASSRRDIRKAISRGLIAKKMDHDQSKGRYRERLAAKRLGRHTGAGKRRGTREARCPAKYLWVRRQRVLRRVLSRYRDAQKVDNSLHHTLYLKCKGNEFKNKRVLIDHIRHEQAERVRMQLEQEKIAIRRERARATRERKLERIRRKRTLIAEGKL
eukprot:gnl/Carplike_NY0171/486_a671_3611.p1 GENE.gnl/Carplike_NY0171/486_a671_3611~~gnl/Carplike_NY0171/486_a671_3611.p1  ORF type:complete len:189 (-),score=67.54 gnl/Carplike_NY0171/486_a671_3611:40-606(-)